MTAASAAMEARERMLMASVMARITNMPSAIPRLVAMEVIEGLFATSWERAVVAVMRIEAIVHVTVEAARAMKPRPCPQEHASDKPVGPVVAVGRAVVGCVVKVAVGTYRRCSDADGDLGCCGGCTANQDGC